MKLIEKAKKTVYIPPTKAISEEQMELIEAWLKDEITIAQISKVLELPNTSTYIFLARGAKLYFKSKRI